MHGRRTAVVLPLAHVGAAVALQVCAASCALAARLCTLFLPHTIHPPYQTKPSCAVLCRRKPWELNVPVDMAFPCATQVGLQCQQLLFRCCAWMQRGANACTAFSR